MSYIKFSEDLFLEKQEYNRFQKFLMEDGYKKNLLDNSESFGYIKNKKQDVDFTSGLVSEGTVSGNVNINSINFIDANGNYGVLPSFTELPIGISEGESYWLNVEHKYSAIEEGTVSIDINGNLTGTGTKFTEVIRGEGNFQSSIKFENAVNNSVYYVQEVIDDENAVLTGSFSNESELQYSVIGTFTPTSVPPESDRYPFQYDSYNLLIQEETELGVNPSAISDTLFSLSRITMTGGQLVIEDKRVQLWKTKAESYLENIPSASPCIGVEASKYQHPSETRVDNIVQIAWGFRSDNWTVNSSLNQITINGGLGGKFKTTGDFSDGDFNGMRLYSENGKYSIVKSSIKQGNQINIRLEQLNPSDFTNTSFQLLVTPDCESIEFYVNTNSSEVTELPNEKFTFPINTYIGELNVLAYNEVSNYDVKYRFVNNSTYSEIKTIPSDLVSGYLTESSFDEDGVLNTNPANVTRKTYDTSTDDWLEITRSSTAYSEFTNKIDLNDNSGFEVKLDLENEAANNNRKIPLIVGINKQHIRFNGTTQLTGDVRIQLLDTDVKNGSSFYIYLDGAFDNDQSGNRYNIIISQKVSDVESDKITLTQPEINSGNIHFKAVYQSGSWYIEKVNADYDGRDVFKGGKEDVYVSSYQNESILNNAGTESSNFNVLTISGDYKNVQIYIDIDIVIDKIRVLNGKSINNLNIRIKPSTLPDFKVSENWSDYVGVRAGKGRYYGFITSFNMKGYNVYTYTDLDDFYQQSSSSEIIEVANKVEYNTHISYQRNTSPIDILSKNNYVDAGLKVYGVGGALDTEWCAVVNGVLHVDASPGVDYADANLGVKFKLLTQAGVELYSGITSFDTPGQENRFSTIIPIHYTIKNYKQTSSSGTLENNFVYLKIEAAINDDGSESNVNGKIIRSELTITFHPETNTTIQNF